jgi:SAM-dependent methyltransferase
MASPHTTNEVTHSKTPHPSKELVESTYDKIAVRYLEWTSSSPSPRLNYLTKLLFLLNKSHKDGEQKPKVLELGCGAGVPSTKVLAESCEVIGNDISAVSLDLARSNVPGATFIKGDMMDLEFENGSLDAVLGFYSIIHLPREEQVVLMKRIWRWVKEGGYLLVNLGTKDSEESVNQDWLGGGGGMYWSGFGVEGNLEMVRGAGWEIVESEVIVDEEKKLGGGKVDVGFVWVLARKGLPSGTVAKD